MSTLTAPTRSAAAATLAAPTHAGSFVRDTAIVMTRELRPLRRDPFSIVFGMVQPLVFLGLFGPLLAGSLGGPAGGVWQWFVPTILVMTTLFGTSTTGANLLVELQSGAHERMLVTPLSRSSLLVGRALKEMVPLAGQCAVILVVMTPLSTFDLHLAGALLGFGMLAVFGVGLGALSYALALAVRKQDWMFWVVQQTFLFPLLILSGMLLPLENGPAWMRTAAELNPLAYLVNAEQALFAGDLWSRTVAGGWIAAAATAAVGLATGVRKMARSAD